jgi:spore coat protein U-like protein
MTLVRLLALATACTIAPAAQAVVCSAATSGLAFGGYDMLSPAPLTATVNVRVTCSLQSADGPAQRVVASVIALSPGLSGTFAQRQMASGAARMNYNVFTSNAYASVWGDGAGASSTRSTALTLNPARPSRAEDVTGYGRATALQDLLPGQYSDTLLVTVSF